MYYNKNARRAPAQKHEPLMEAPPPDTCFAEKAAKWVTVLAFVVALLFALGVHRFCQNLGKQSRGQRSWSNVIGHAAAFNPGAAPAVAQVLTIPELALDAAPALDGQGVELSAVYAGGPAEAAGLQQSDQILRFNGRKVRTPVQFQDLVSRALPEASVTVDFLRDGAPAQTLIRVGEGEFAPPPAPAQPAAVGGIL
jgi:S1-C subfamily serine protease